MLVATQKVVIVSSLAMLTGEDTVLYVVAEANLYTNCCMMVTIVEDCSVPSMCHHKKM